MGNNFKSYLAGKCKCIPKTQQWKKAGPAEFRWELAGLMLPAAPALQPSCEGAFQWAVHVCRRGVHVCRRGVPMPTSGSGCTCAVSCAGVPGFTPKGQDSLHLGTSCSLKSLESTTSCYLLRGWAEWEKHSIITSRQQEPETNSGFFCVSCQNTFLWAE